MKITALIDTGKAEVIVTACERAYIPDIGDGFSGRFNDENGNTKDASGTVLEVLSISEDWL